MDRILWCVRRQPSPKKIKINKNTEITNKFNYNFQFYHTPKYLVCMRNSL